MRGGKVYILILNQGFNNIQFVSDELEYDENDSVYEFQVGVGHGHGLRGMEMYYVSAGKDKDIAEKEREYCKQAAMSIKNYAMSVRLRNS